MEARKDGRTDGCTDGKYECKVRFKTISSLLQDEGTLRSRITFFFSEGNSNMHLKTYEFHQGNYILDVLDFVSLSLAPI